VIIINQNTISTLVLIRLDLRRERYTEIETLFKGEMRTYQKRIQILAC